MNLFDVCIIIHFALNKNLIIKDKPCLTLACTYTIFRAHFTLVVIASFVRILFH